jgi:CHAT domain-containing protein
MAPRDAKWAPETKSSLDPAMRSMLILAGANQRYGPLHTASLQSAGQSTPSKTAGPPTPGSSQHQGQDQRDDQLQYQGEDGLLTAYEARDLDLRETDLVVLVGCESAVGPVPRTNWHFSPNTIMAAGMGMQVAGPGQASPIDPVPRVGDDAVNGLPAAFYIAGARSIVSSSWAIPVQSSEELIGDFLEIWLRKNQGGNRFSAFHSAQLSALKRAREKADTHPFRWAGMMYLGAPDDAPQLP